MIDLAHIHPMLVHFPLALVPVVFGLQTLALIRRQGVLDRGCLQATAVGLLAFAAVAAIVAAIFGDQALDIAVAKGFSGWPLHVHAILGQITATVVSVLAVIEIWLYLRARPAGKRLGWAVWFAGLAVVVLLIVTAWFGGHLVYDLGVNVVHTTP